jgi:acyl-CoA reductase-like NAD-dependent aldehyde dehydrogenase
MIRTSETIHKRMRHAANEFPALIARHRNCFLSGKTRPVEWREAQLDALHALMTERADEFFDALWKDLRRNRVDADATDVKYVADEAAYARHHLRRWMHPLHVSTPLIMAPGRTEIRFDPLGVGLIIGAWNYPIMLSLSPLVAAIAGGNAAVIKPSEVSPACADAIARLVPQYLDAQAFSVVVGGVPEATALLAQEWDHIFFTGGPPIGKVVMAAAAKNLTPVVLELGGKNPTIVHDTADSRVAARRIAQGRWVNAGQTCTAPDHVLVFKAVAQEFLVLEAGLLQRLTLHPGQVRGKHRILQAQALDLVLGGRFGISQVVLHVGNGLFANALVADTPNRGLVRPADQSLRDLRQRLGEGHLPSYDARAPRFPFLAIGVVFKTEGRGKRRCPRGFDSRFGDQRFKEIKQYSCDHRALCQKILSG